MARAQACQPGALIEAGELIRLAVDDAFARGIRPYEAGGKDGTQAISRAVLRALESRELVSERVAG
jgi:hypothetical protein